MSHLNRRRCVITGLGVISSLGNTPEDLYASLQRGDCGIRVMEEWKDKPFGAEKFLGAPVALPPDFVKSIPRSMRLESSDFKVP